MDAMTAALVYDKSHEMTSWWNTPVTALEDTAASPHCMTGGMASIKRDGPRLCISQMSCRSSKRYTRTRPNLEHLPAFNHYTQK